MLRYIEVMAKLKSIEREDIIAHSAVDQTDFLSTFTNSLKPNGILEIGTYNGISTAVLASIAKHVYTFDIAYRDAELILNLFDLRYKVSMCAAPQQQIDFEFYCLHNCWAGYWKDWLNFDFAFVDGDHTYEAVKHDFSLVKFTGRVLFHDVNFEPIKKFAIDELGAKVVSKDGRFGYWHN